MLRALVGAHRAPRAPVLLARGLATGSQKTQMVEELWKIKRQAAPRPPRHLDVLSVEGGGATESRSQRIEVKPHHIIHNLAAPSTSTEAIANPADLIPSLASHKCNVCGRVYKNRKFLNSHFKKSSNCAAHTSKMPGYLPPEPDPPPKPPRPRKAREATAERPHVCTDCNKGFKTVAEYQKHRRRSQKCLALRGGGDQQTHEERLKLFIGSLGTDNPLSIEELELQFDQAVRKEKKVKEQDQNKKLKDELRFMVETCGGVEEVARVLEGSDVVPTIKLLHAEEVGEDLSMKTKDDVEVETKVLKQAVRAMRQNDELYDVLEAAREVFPCQWCGKEFKTRKGFSNHEAKGCKKKPLTAEEAAAKAAAEEAEKNEKIRAELIATRRPLLASWFDIMVNQDRTSEALEDFRRLRSHEKFGEVVEWIGLYDILMRGFARRNQVRRVQELWQEADAAGLTPTVETYISALMAFSSVSREQEVFVGIAREIYQEFLAAGHTVAAAIDTAMFEYDDKQQLLDTLQGLLGLSEAEVRGGERVAHPHILGQVYREGGALLQSPIEGVLAREELGPLVERQVELEQRGLITVPSILRTDANKARGDAFKRFTEEMQLDWRKKVAAALEKRVEGRMVEDRDDMVDMQLFLAAVPIPRLVDIVVNEARYICLNSETFSEPVNWMAAVMGNLTMEAYFLDNKRRKDTSYWSNLTTGFSRYLDWFAEPRGATTHREAISQATEAFRLDRPRILWPDSIKLAVGKELLHILVREINIDIDQARNVVVKGRILDHATGKLRKPVGTVSHNHEAFLKIFRQRKMRDVEECKPHPAIWKLYEVNNMVEFDFRALDLPMVCPPLPWVSHTTGAYISLNSELVKVTPKAVSDQQERLAGLAKGAMDPVYDSVNQLSALPWKVHKPLLDLAIKIFMMPADQNKLKLALDIPVHCDSLKPPTLGKLDPAAYKERQLSKEEKLEYFSYVRDKQEYEHSRVAMYSRYCDLLYRISLSKYFEDDILWFPHNLDFRGRAYPLAPLINHMGSDLPRSLLVFAKGKPLGRQGFDWLKLHVVNLTELKKKESIAARMAFAEEMLPEMLDSADDPLGGRRWWLSSDSPWQTLSACMEVAAAVRHPAGPEAFVSHLPIHQDGSCNGLQHYAALGRDCLGASAVNLVPSEVPGDVYSEIATIVEQKRAADSAAGNEVARSLEGFVVRKVVKRPVMTTVYGVTNYGAAKQIRKELEGLEGFSGDAAQASKYLAAKVFESLNVLFEASQEIQDWLTGSAEAVAGDCQENVTWVTPLGLPVVQPYTTRRAKQDGHAGVSMNMAHLYSLSASQVTELRVSKMKHKNGFAPNFIHSLDSSHMMLTSLHLWPRGVTFASVHDCFWTHAADVPAMNSVCREQFISLHSSPILESLSKHFLRHHSEGRPPELLPEKMRELAKVNRKKREMLFANLPNKGNLDLNVIRDSTFFFS